MCIHLFIMNCDEIYPENAKWSGSSLTTTTMKEETTLRDKISLS